MDNMDTPAAEDRHDASRRALLRDALARERAADVVARLRDRVDRLALTRRRRDWEQGVGLAAHDLSVNYWLSCRV